MRLQRAQLLRAQLLAFEELVEQRVVRLRDGLDELFAQIDLTDSQYETAKARYEAVSAWLAEGESPFLQDAAIYAQGSIAVGTAEGRARLCPTCATLHGLGCP